jgi:hypothetical protein
MYHVSPDRSESTSSRLVASSEGKRVHCPGLYSVHRTQERRRYLTAPAPVNTIKTAHSDVQARGKKTTTNGPDRGRRLGQEASAPNGRSGPPDAVTAHEQMRGGVRGVVAVWGEDRCGFQAAHLLSGLALTESTAARNALGDRREEQLGPSSDQNARVAVATDLITQQDRETGDYFTTARRRPALLVHRPGRGPAKVDPSR